MLQILLLATWLYFYCVLVPGFILTQTTRANDIARCESLKIQEEAQLNKSQQLPATAASWLHNIRWHERGFTSSQGQRASDQDFFPYASLQKLEDGTQASDVKSHWVAAPQEESETATPKLGSSSVSKRHKKQLGATSQSTCQFSTKLWKLALLWPCRSTKASASELTKHNSLQWPLFWHLFSCCLPHRYYN